MKKSEIWEWVILLVSAVLLFPIMASSQKIVLPLPASLLKVLGILQYPIVVVLGVIVVRRLRRVMHALRENKNRPGPF